ncbi:hypothetical protein C8J56DRAFT_1029768 [Mycena floridula]|nr:hypothetical protein C8J56DRAFT_1029768 [Mycena floridula]
MASNPNPIRSGNSTTEEKRRTNLITMHIANSVWTNMSPRRARRRRAKREEMVITAFNEHPQPARIPLAQDHDSENHNLDSNPDSGSPTTVSEAPTVRQQRIRAQSQSVTARIADLEGLVPRLQDAEAEIQRLRAENLRLRDQEQSDWALEVSDSPPPSYRETGTT